MADLTGLFGVDWAIVFFLLFGAAVAVMSVRRDRAGFRLGPALAVPLISGTVLIIRIVTTLGDSIRRFAPFLTRTVTVIVIVGAAFVAIAVADFLYSRLAPLPEHVWPTRPPVWVPDLGLLLFLGGAAAASLIAVGRLSSATYVEPLPTGLNARLVVERSYPLPSAPLDVVMDGETSGFVSLGTRIARFELPVDGDESLSLETVADGFTYTRGMTIVDDVLVVADLGPLPCPNPYPICKGEGVPGVDVPDGERLILQQSRGRLIAFDIDDTGALQNERAILEDLPVANTEHGVNDVITGPDGRIYVSIGNLDHLDADDLARIHQPHEELLGTIVRLSSDGSDVEVFAKGLRNVFGLTFDPGGGLWGVDNDGSTPQGWRAEEVLHIQEDANYGYPQEGSFGDLKIRDDFAVWHATGPGSAGVLWAEEVGLGPGLLIASADHIDGLELVEMSGTWAVEDRYAYSELTAVPGIVTHMEPMGDGRILASGIYPDALYVVAVDKA